MFPIKTLLLAVICLSRPLQMAASDGSIRILGLLTSDRVNPPGVNLPYDRHSIKDGINIYPPRTNRPSVTMTNVSTSSVSDPKDNSCPYTAEDANQLLDSIDKIVNYFYSNNYKSINMRSDGGVGLGVLKGQMNYLLANRVDKLSPKLKAFFEQLHSMSGQLALDILDQSIQATNDLSAKFGSEVMRNNSNILQARSRDWLDLDKITKYFGEFENIGDDKEVQYPFLDFHCLVSLVRDCTIPHVCQKMYLTDIYSQYMLIHQILFQQFAERRSCITVNQKSFGNAQQYRDRLCAKAYLEAEFLEVHDFPTRYIDLFAEQVGFCGLMGYPNFLRADWLREIMSWQIASKSGCITDLYGEQKTTDTVIFAKVKENGESIEEPCLVHLTSVSLMALSVNLRYMMDVCSSNMFDGHFA